VLKHVLSADKRDIPQSREGNAKVLDQHNVLQENQRINAF